MSPFNIVRSVMGQKDIKRSAKIRIELELRRSDVVNILAVYTEAYGFAGMADLTGQAVGRIVRRMLRDHGKRVCNGLIPEHLQFDSKTVSQQSEEWAERQVSLFWPQTEEDS